MMPDFERLIDGLRKHCAKTPADHDYSQGYSGGKTRARLEVLVLVVVAVLSFVTWRVALLT